MDKMNHLLFGRIYRSYNLHDAIYWLRFYSNSLIHILSLSNLYNNVASIQKNRGGGGDKSHRVIMALSCNCTGYDSSQTRLFIFYRFPRGGGGTCQNFDRDARPIFGGLKFGQILFF